MSDSMLNIQDPYRVRPNDTLSAIARRAGLSVTSLQRLNGITNPNKIEVGRVLYLSEASAFGVSVSFLDALRHPVANLPFRLQIDGRTITGKTNSNGLVPQQITKDAKSTVEIWVHDALGTWQRVHNTMSGYGHKLITLVSDAIVVKTQTGAHPTGAPAVPNKPKTSTATPTSQAGTPTKPQGTASTNNPAVKTKKTKGPQGQPVVEIGVELPEGLMAYFTQFKGGDITSQDWKKVAENLGCEPEVLMAIAKVESGGRSAFWRLNRGDGAHIPAILYERHYFSDLTNGKYDSTHPDISWPVGYRKKSELGSTDKKMHDHKVDADDIYSSYATSYLRLINAYRLDPGAALQSCSWGKFQIMGRNYVLCGAASIEEFVSAMCAAELGQIQLLAGFIQKKPRAWKNPKNKALGKEISLWDAVKTKDWKAIAFNYNGPSYATYGYDTKIQAAYDAYKKAAHE